MGEKAPLPLGNWIAAAGAVGLLFTLFRPWYKLNFPDDLLSEANSLAPELGDFAPLLTQALAELERSSAFTATGWQVFESADIVLAALAAVVLAAAALSAIGPEWIARGGAAAAVLVAYKLAVPPGASPQLEEQLLQPVSAAYVALACAVAMAAGGAMAMRTPS
jgi:hypothetical protein